MRILFLTATRVGDAVLSTGLLDHLLRTHPQARFTIACGPAAAGVFARMPRRERTIVVAKHPWRLHWATLWREAAGTRWDGVVDLRGSAFAWTLRAGWRAVMSGRRPGHRLGQIAAVLGLDSPPRPVAWWNAADAARAAALLPGGPVLALGPTANWVGKLWAPERFAQLAARLTAPDGPLPGARVAVLGGPGPAEAALASPVLAALGPAAIDLVGRLTLPEAGAVLARAALFVGNDSGLMHLSAAAGAPTIGLFGPSPAAAYAPIGRCAAAVVSPLSPAPASLRALEVAAVLDAAERLLAQRAPA